MGLHDLSSESLIELMDDMSDGLEKSTMFGWIDELMAQYASVPGTPGGTQVEVLGHLLDYFRGLYFSRKSKTYMRKAELLLQVVEANRDNRLAVYLELVDEPGFEQTLAKYTVHKGTLFETEVSGRPVVVWHPDKDFKPKAASRVKHTGYSLLGRRKRRREAQKRADNA